MNKVRNRADVNETETDSVFFKFLFLMEPLYLDLFFYLCQKFMDDR